MEQIEIKVGNTQDVVRIIDEIPEFEEKFSKEEIEIFLRLKDSIIYTAFVGDNPAGFLVCYKDTKNGWISAWIMGVLPQFRKRGVASKLLEREERFTIESGYTRLKSDVNSKRADMLRLLLKLNYYIVGVELHENIKKSKIYLEKIL